MQQRDSKLRKTVITIERDNDIDNLPCAVHNLAINSGLSGSRTSAAIKLPSSPGQGRMHPFPSLNLFISARYVSRFLAEITTFVHSTL